MVLVQKHGITVVLFFASEHGNTEIPHVQNMLFGHDAMVFNQQSTWYHGTATKFLGESFKYHSNRLKNT